MTSRSFKNSLTLAEGEGKRKQGPIMGIDVHKRILAYCILTETRILSEGEIVNDTSGRNQVLQLVNRFKVRAIALEATSQYHFPLMFQLLEAQCSILVANPQQTKNTQGKKTDKLDARRIAVAHRDGRLLPSVLPPRAWMELRKNNRTLLQLIQEQTKIKQRLQQLFHLHDFTLQPYYRAFLNTQWILEVFYSTFTTERMISELVEDNYPRNPAKRTVKDRTRINYLVTALSRFKQAMSRMEQRILATHLLQLQLNRQMQTQYRLNNYHFAKTHTIIRKTLKILLSVQGIGPDTAYVLLGEIVDITYFASPQQLVKWAGLAPRVYQSGQRKHKTGKIHKGGNKYVRRALTIACANIYARQDINHPIYRFIKSKYQETGQYWLAICAGARKLLSVLWYLLRRNESWAPPHLQNPALVQALQTKIQQKIQVHIRQIDRCEKLQHRLTTQLGQQLSSEQSASVDPNHLLKELLKLT